MSASLVILNEEGKPKGVRPECQSSLAPPEKLPALALTQKVLHSIKGEIREDLERFKHMAQGQSVGYSSQWRARGEV